MYKKYIAKLCLCNILFWICWFGSYSLSSGSQQEVAYLTYSADKVREVQATADHYFSTMKRVSSGQRIVDYEILKKNYKYNLSAADYEALLKIVQAEAGCEDETGKMLVAGVIMNRVNDKRFPNTVREVISQQDNGSYQFSPMFDGTYENALVSKDTVCAVERVLCGEDLTKGALYFAARKYADPEKMHWFDNSLKWLFQHGGHEFFTSR